MTMLTGLTDEGELQALEASNTNRTKPWKQYRDQIMRLSPSCDAATTFDDVGLTTKKVTQEQQSSSTSSSALSLSTMARKAKVALAYSFIDNDELFDDQERFSILQKCSIHGDCLWREITTSAVERWWHLVDGQRAGRCYRSDAHSKGASCDAFKSRKFLLDALVEDKEAATSSSTEESSSSSSSGSSSSTTKNKKKGAKMVKRKQEAGQKSVDKNYASGAVLASFPGSGNTWSRMLLEYASGYYTGSIYNDITLMPVLPAEGVRTHEVLAWKAHTFPSQYVDNYKPAKVVLLVRHPISALWSEFQRRMNVEAGSRGGGGHVAAIKTLSNSDKTSFKSWSSCMACRWIQYITAHLQLAQVIPLKILLFERLSVDTINAMREVLEFLGVNEIDEDRLLCATRLADHPLVHRPPANFTMHDAFKSFPEQACTILRTIEQTDQGRLIMRLLGYGNSIKPPKTCLAEVGDVFTCGDMLTEEFTGSKQCKMGSTSSSQSQSQSQSQLRSSSSSISGSQTLLRGSGGSSSPGSGGGGGSSHNIGRTSTSSSSSRNTANSNSKNVGWKTLSSTTIGESSSTQKTGLSARAKYEAARHKQ